MGLQTLGQATPMAGLVGPANVAAASPQVSISLNNATSDGAYSGFNGNATNPNPQDLTAAGTTDWKIWGSTSTSLTGDNGKAGGTSIGTLTDIEGGAPIPLRALGPLSLSVGTGLATVPFSFKWSNGTSPANAVATRSGLQHEAPSVGSVGYGFSFTVPATGSAQRLTLWVSAHHGTGRLTASLTSATTTDAGVAGGQNNGGVYTIDFTSDGTSGQTLNVQYVLDSHSSLTNDGFGQGPNEANVAIYAAALSPVAGPPATVGVPALVQAVPQGPNTVIAGVLHADPSTTYHLRFATSPTCTNGILGGDAVTFATQDAVTDMRGDSYFGGTVVNTDTLSTYVAAQIVPPGASSAVGPCIVASPDNDQWPRALDISGGSSTGYIDDAGRARWYKFPVQPGSRVSVTLSNVPADYDLFLFKDIGQAYTSLTDTASLTKLSAEFAPSAFSPSAFSPSAFSPSAFSPSAFSPSAFSPSAFSPSAFSPSAFSPSAFSPSAFSPSAFSPSAFSPSAFSPSAFSPSAFSPSAFSSAQTRSLIGVSAGVGIGDETVVADTWNNTGFFYVRVSGKNGASSLAAPFSVSVTIDGNLCAGVGPSGAAPTSAPGLGLKTLILQDSSRLLGTPTEISTLQTKLTSLAGRTEVAGAVVDLASDGRIQALNTQADAHTACIYGKNLVASGIKDIVTAYRATNPGLQYIVLVGGDRAIPFFRYPDQSLLGPESDYVPPVGSTTASEASLRANYVLGQDAYGSSTELSLRASTFPVPDLAVGRLVETASEASGMIDAYLTTTGGVAATPTTSLVTGYDFLADAATSVQGDLNAGTGRTGDALITPNNVAPTVGWTATQLKSALFGTRHDLIFLAGHFSANNALAADFSTTVNSTDLAAATVDLTNSIVFSAGCHSGYNLVDQDAINGVTQPLDWSQAFAQKRATLIAGTGYQYGDTDFLEYSERIYAEFAHQLRVGTGPVSVGQALVRAKQIYLARTPEIRGIHEKALLESTLFGLPMLSVNMPSGRVPASSTGSIVGSTDGFTADPGLTLGLTSADVTVTPAIGAHNVVLQTLDASGSPVTGGSLTATYYSGRDGVVTNPGEPALPLQSDNVTVTGKVLRGVGFRGGTYTDSTVVPLTGAAATEIRGVHSAFSSTVFYPMRPWTVNYYDALSGGATRLLVTPAQHKVGAIGDTNATLRLFGGLNLRLFYSDYIGEAAQSAAPTITGITASASGQVVTFRAHVVGNPAAGIQQVWITHTGTGAGPSGSWQSIDLAQDATDSTLWAGSLTLPVGVSAADLRFMIQAANGVGLVALDDNLGAYYAVASPSGATPTATSLLLGANPTTGVYGSSTSVTVTLSGGTVSGKTVVFTIGATTRIATTDASGVATASLPLTSAPGSYSLSASFAGDPTSTASNTSRAFTITKLGTSLTLAVASPTIVLGADSGVTATLNDASGAPLGFRTIFFILSGAASRTTTVITDFAGRARLGTLPSAVGAYTVSACFNGPLPAACDTLSIPDRTYGPSGATSTVRQIWPFTGFFSPVDNLPILNTASAGQAIPVKFSLGGNRGLGIFQTGFPKFVQITCSTTAPTDLINEFPTASTSNLQYDPTTNRYSYVWKTTRTMAGLCYQLQLGLLDGNTVPIANFRFK